jgi:UDP-N-acetylmuramoylalanine--D-glutamate ligase
MAASLAAKKAGVPNEAICQVLQTFKGVEHRLELVKKIDGVSYINDSKATTVESLFYALQSFKQPVILIAGGKDKGSDFSKLNAVIKKHVKHIILIGVAAEKMKETWQEIKPVSIAENLRDAVCQARKIASGDEVVLLSPACASFDMFNDYEDRGRQFKQIVNQLED